ncbi:murein biosynthesis integral membrane protein MurJ [Sulfurospirillum sp. T05]|uniref:Probable lipid II flippase MurJ n=1 Tax=Sulfurospirillum tamanense TaxID=2813362 RepID=A0ABS2WR36_9BACT|nr:murein biosynthesis integral membrane protein MurJ [Sulfurospirillum tamanensis]MBN2964128.1 murein biosynthesis integral membrane protein MurJ [Sulfurospirillum tamanensis]
MVIRSFFTNSIGILVSRILGFIRDILTASILGANLYSDIFFVAFKLPNLFRRIFAEGAFTQAFLPAFTRATKKGLFAASVFLRFSFFILILTLLVMVFAPWLTKLIAFGFDEATIALAAPLVRINFWYLLLIYGVTLAASMLHYRGHFATTAFSTALLNLAMIGALLLSNTQDPHQAAWNLSFGVLVGGLLQALTHLIALKKFRLLKVFLGSIGRPKKSATEPSFYRNFFHGVLGGSTAQLSAFLDTWLASFLAFGSISYLYYANRVFQLPLALFAIALSVAIFPNITKALKREGEEKARRFLEKGFWILCYLLCAATLGGTLLSHEITWLLFERGSFGAKETLNTALVLQMYLVGLLPFGLARLFSLWLYANQMQARAAKISAFSLMVNIVLSLALIGPLEAAGLALASSLSGVVLFALTVHAYGTRAFLAIMRPQNIIGLIGVLLATGALVWIIKEILRGYL